MIPVYAAASEEHYNDIAHVIPLVTRAMFKEFTPRVALIGWTEAQVDELRNMVQLYTGRSIEIITDSDELMKLNQVRGSQ